MTRTIVVPLTETSIELSDGVEIVLQKAVYRYAEGGKPDIFYRFIRRENGKLKAQRGQCGIPDLETIRILVEEMEHTEKHNNGSLGLDNG